MLHIRTVIHINVLYLVYAGPLYGSQSKQQIVLPTDWRLVRDDLPRIIIWQHYIIWRRLFIWLALRLIELTNIPSLCWYIFSLLNYKTLPDMFTVLSLSCFTEGMAIPRFQKILASWFWSFPEFSGQGKLRREIRAGIFRKWKNGIPPTYYMLKIFCRSASILSIPF